VEIFLAKPVGLDLEERKDKTYLCCVFLFYNLLLRYFYKNLDICEKNKPG
jgi:hypothetical protein